MTVKEFCDLDFIFINLGDRKFEWLIQPKDYKQIKDIVIRDAEYLGIQPPDEEAEMEEITEFWNRYIAKYEAVELIERKHNFYLSDDNLKDPSNHEIIALDLTANRPSFLIDAFE